MSLHGLSGDRYTLRLVVTLVELQWLLTMHREEAAYEGRFEEALSVNLQIYLIR